MILHEPGHGFWEAVKHGLEAAATASLRPGPPSKLPVLHLSRRSSHRTNPGHTIDLDGLSYEIAPTSQKTSPLPSTRCACSGSSSNLPKYLALNHREFHRVAGGPALFCHQIQFCTVTGMPVPEP